MWRVVLLAFCYHVVSQAQPATDDPSPRHTRELIECCPCPGKGSDMLGRQSRMEDDCPCRGRSADSEGTSSMLFPTRSGPGRTLNSVPFMRSNTPKDELKNLLEPEVGLAASMLETLREATEEEYQDALARDAARDAVPEESRNVVIIVKPRSNDDFISEASNVKESRCILPLGRARTVSQPFRTLPNVLGHPKATQPKVMHLWDRDSNVGASNVQESIVNKNGDETPRRLFRLGTPLRDAIKSSTIKQNPTVLDMLKSRPNIFERLNLPLIPKMNVDTSLRKANKINTNNDLSPSPSIIQEDIEKVPERNGIPQFNKRPQLLKNLLNLRDVELLPKATPKTFKLKSNHLNKEQFSDSNSHDDCDSTYDSEMNEKVLMPQNKSKKEKFNQQIQGNEGIKNNKQLNEENIQDALTSPSESVSEIVSLPKTILPDKTNCNDLNSEDIIATTTESLSKALQEDSELSESLEQFRQQSGIQDVDNNEEESSISHEVNETAEVANEDSDMNTNNNKEDVISFNNMDDKKTFLLPDSNKDIGEPVIKVDEALSNDGFLEDQTHNIEPISSLIDKENFVPKIQTTPITETLSTLRDNVRKSLENMKNKSFISGSAKPEENRSAALADIQYQEPKTEKTSEQVEHSAKNAPEQVTFKDLQKFSDDLLVLSSNNEESTTSKEEEEEEDAEQGSEEQEPTNKTDSELQDDSTSISDKGINNFINAEVTKDKPCIFLDKKKMEKSNEQSESAIQNVSLNDMSSKASAPSPRILPALSDPINLNDHMGPSLLQNFDPLDPLNLKKKLGSIQLDPLSLGEKLRSPSLPDLDSLNLNEKLASPLLLNLDPLNVGSLLQDIIPPTIQVDPLNLLSKTTEVVKFPTIQDVSLNDMSSEASAPSPSIIPALLDPLNLNDQTRPSLFQNLNPLDPLNLNKKLESIQIDPFNLSEKLRSPSLPDLDPLNLNEKLASPLLPILDPLNVGSAIQDIIPPTIQDDPLNLLAQPITEVLKLPTLEDLREGLASVFDNNEKSAENNLSDESKDCTDDVSEMASAASNTNAQVPPIKPLEDLNVDIFQLNPLSSSQKDILSKVPRLNLNNFRTKLPIPTNLELKPIKLESRVGNSKGKILGASLTFGDKTVARKAKSQSNLLGQPLGNLPSLDELRNTLHSGAHSLLGSVSKPNIDLFRNSHVLSSGLPDIGEIHRNAEKTFKGLQQRMRSSLNGGGLNVPLNDKFANPQNLLEDMNDKLKAIHYDLSDRLSSIHEDFLDKSKIIPLVIPKRTPTSTGRNSNHKELNTFRKIKAKPSRLQVSASTISSQGTDPFDNENENSVFRSPNKNSLKRLHINPQRGVVGAESSIVPIKVDSPIPRTTIDFPKKFMLAPLSQRVPTIRHGSENLKGKPLTLLKQSSLKTPFLRKPSPFKEKTGKVTITFASTTPAPVTLPLENDITTPSFKATKTSIQGSKGETLKEGMSLPRSKSLNDATPLPSGSTPLRMSTPVKSKNNFKIANTYKDFPHLQNTEAILNVKPKILNHKGLRDDRLSLNDNNADRLKFATLANNEPEIKNQGERQIKPIVWPKSGEDSFLVKVREAMQARLASFDPKKTSKVNIEKVDTVKMDNSDADMFKSATENHDVNIEAPLKESVPYKCRLMCTRE